MTNNNEPKITDSLRRQWHDVGKDISLKSPEDIANAIGKRHSLVKRLRTRYLLTSIIGITAPVWIVLLASMTPVSALLIACYSTFCVGMGFINLFVWYRLGEVPMFMSLPLLEAQTRMIGIYKLRRNIKYLSYIFGIPVIALIFYELGAKNDTGILYGGIIGGTIGGILGLIKDIKDRRQLKALIRFFESQSLGAE